MVILRHGDPMETSNTTPIGFPNLLSQCDNVIRYCPIENDPVFGEPKGQILVLSD